jgi:hypothetical protein
MLRAGLPPVTTVGTEITRLVRDRQAGLVSPVADADALRQNLLWASGHPEELGAMGERGKTLFRECFTIEAVSGPLCSWAEAPGHSPDYGDRIGTEGLESREGMISEGAAVAKSSERGLTSRLLGRLPFGLGKRHGQ